MAGIPPNIAAMLELERRGKLPPAMAGQLEMARRQGIVKPLVGEGAQELTPTARSKAQGQLRAMGLVEQQLDDVESQYNANLKGDPTGTFGAAEYLPLPSMKKFDTSANAILPIVRQALSTSAKDGDSDRELAVWTGLLPNSKEYDAVNEQRIKQMRALARMTRSENERILGGKQALTGNKTKAQTGVWSIEKER